MHPLMMEIAPLVRQGYCCSQLLALLMLEQGGAENPALVRAMQGLCHGIGRSDGPCGLLTGGACALAALTGKGARHETPHPMLTPLLNEYAGWFYDRVAEYGGTNCEAIAAGLGATAKEAGGAPDPVACGELLAECWRSAGTKSGNLSRATGWTRRPRVNDTPRTRRGRKNRASLF